LTLTDSPMGTAPAHPCVRCIQNILFITAAWQVAETNTPNNLFASNPPWCDIPAATSVWRRKFLSKPCFDSLCDRNLPSNRAQLAVAAGYPNDVRLETPSALL